MFKFRVKWLSALDYKMISQIADYIGFDYDSRLHIYRLNPVKAAQVGSEKVVKILMKLNTYVPSEVIDKIKELEKVKPDVLIELSSSDLIIFSIDRNFIEYLKGKKLVIWDGVSKTIRAKPKDLHTIIKESERHKLRVKVNFKLNYELSFIPQLKVELRGYQREALKKWEENSCKGVIVLPVAAGKTIIGLKAIEKLRVRTLILVPTLDLMNQWRDNVVEKLGIPINKVGLFGGGRREIKEITIMTYDSAYVNLDNYPTYFGLVIADECHHAVSQSYRKALEVITAPYRLGLTATPFRSDGLHKYYDSILGPILYSLTPEELQELGYLARHIEKRIYVKLSEEEYNEYNELMKRYLEYCKKKIPHIKDPRLRFKEVLKLAAKDPEAREALRAKNRARQIALSTEKKLEIVEKLLKKYKDEKILIFSRYTDIVRELSKKFLIPRILHDTPKDERKLYLKLFREGKIRILATAMALDEGVDVPDASMAIIISGTGSHREYVQRLGRILRPKEKEALLIEIITKKTIEPSLAKRRRKPKLFLEEDIS